MLEDFVSLELYERIKFLPTFSNSRCSEIENQNEADT